MSREKDLRPLLIVYGAGELGARVAQRWVKQGGRAIGVTLSTKRHGDLAGFVIQPVLKDHFRVPTEAASWVLATPGSQNQSEAIRQLSGHDLTGRAVLCGSTAIFRREETERKRRAHEMERVFSTWAGDRGVVLRLGGLYREGRGPFNSLKNGRIPPPAPGSRALPLVHYDDAATAVLNAVTLSRADSWYAVASQPVPTRGEFYELASKQLGVDVPLTDHQMDMPDFELSRTREAILVDMEWPDWRGAVL